MASTFLLALLATTSLRFGVQALPTKPCNCPPFTNGSFTIDQYQLYPENAEWDSKRCLVYFNALFNASIAVYDPYANAVTSILEFPGISHNPSLHSGGVDVDGQGRLAIAFDSAAAFNTAGADVSGDNFLVKYDPSSGSVVWKANLTATSRGRYGGFQDVAHDARGNAYVVGTYPGTVLKVSPDGRTVEEWFVPAQINTTAPGFSGLAAIESRDLLLTAGNGDGNIYRFDTGAEKGTPVLVPRTPNTPIQLSDDVYLPPKYDGTVLLVAEDAAGVAVLRSRDARWKSAEYLGLVPLPADVAATGAVTPAVVQIGESVFIVPEYFFDAPVPGSTAGDRAQFPIVDITADVEKLLA